MTNRTISSTLLEELRQHYSMSFDDTGTELTGGYECDVWRIGDYVVRVCPEWRSDAELDWTYSHVEVCAREIDEVVAPLKTREGRFFFRHNNRAVLLFPYVDGVMLDRGNRHQLVQSAELLANIHLSAHQTITQRPPSKMSAPDLISTQPDPKIIQDAELDVWYNTFMARDDLMIGFIHGDYYRGNILCQDDVINGIIDWDGCSFGAIIREVAWATWEMCKTDNGNHLDTRKSTTFLLAYIQVNQQLTGDELHAVIPLIRHHLRFEIRRSLAMEESGDNWDNEYRMQEIRAFNNLRSVASAIYI